MFEGFDVNRRDFMAGAAVGMVGSLLPQFANAEEIILRPEIEGVDPRYFQYASRGEFHHPKSPIAIQTVVSRVYVYYPEDVKTAQVIVFSHGALTSPNTYLDLFWHWVSHGYVVIAPLHDDAVIKNGPSMRRLTKDDVSEWDIPSLLEDATAWENRLTACRACLDLNIAIENETGIKVDLSRPVIAGHGFGAYIANIAMGAIVTDKTGNKLTLRDGRFFSSIAFAPQGPGVMGLNEDSWKNIKAPMLSLVAENETDFTGQPWKQKGQGFKMAAPGYKHFGVLKQGTSNTFSGQMVGTSPHEAKLYEVIKAFTTGFLKAYVDYDAVAFKDLTTNFFQRMSLGAVMEYRR